MILLLTAKCRRGLLKSLMGMEVLPLLGEQLPQGGGQAVKQAAAFRVGGQQFLQRCGIHPFITSGKVCPQGKRNIRKVGNKRCRW